MLPSTTFSASGIRARGQGDPLQRVHVAPPRPGAQRVADHPRGHQPRPDVEGAARPGLRVQRLGLPREQVPVGDPVALDRPRVHQHQFLLDPGDPRDADRLGEAHPLGRLERRVPHRAAGRDVGEVARVAVDVHDARDRLPRVHARDGLEPDRLVGRLPLASPVAELIAGDPRTALGTCSSTRARNSRTSGGAPSRPDGGGGLRAIRRMTVGPGSGAGLGASTATMPASRPRVRIRYVTFLEAATLPSLRRPSPGSPTGRRRGPCPHGRFGGISRRFGGRSSEPASHEVPRVYHERS